MFFFKGYPSLKYINFNNAGSSFTKISSLKIIRDFLEFENKVGGYNAELLYKEKLNKFYINASKLLNSNSNEISFLQNSTHAWNFLLNSINLKKMKMLLFLIMNMAVI